MKRMILLSIMLVFPAWAVLNAQDLTQGQEPKVEVYYFHATLRCPTCLAVEEQTKKTLEENFDADLKSGTIRLYLLNLEEKENKALTEKFEIGWSSLVLYSPENKQTLNLTEYAFANARSHPDEFREELQKNIGKLLTND